MDEGLRAHERIRKKKDFLFLYQKGHRVKGKYFNLIYHENNLGYSRLGVVVSRKIGKAVLRNKIKRWVRELFRRNKSRIPFPMDILVVATQGIEGISWQVYREEYFRTLNRIAHREKKN
ncbi:MAG: ribonuclease P protein component [Candidatus Aminicenantes bacterium]|nr:ribonuclease P protein component [Candidatus Aminicenantes bacterium]